MLFPRIVVSVLMVALAICLGKRGLLWSGLLTQLRSARQPEGQCSAFGDL